MNRRFRNGVYSRYSMCDWDSSAKMQIKLADRESHRAQRLDKRSWEIVNGLEQRMRNRQCSNTKKLGMQFLFFFITIRQCLRNTVIFMLYCSFVDITVKFVCMCSILGIVCYIRPVAAVSLTVMLL